MLEAVTSHLVLAPDAAIDLQLHTIYSDGTWTPEHLIEYLVSEGFGLVAITDHDRVDTVASLQHLAEKQLPMLAAVEMSTSWKGELTDVLCYGFDPERNVLHELAQDIAHRQRENTGEVCENLRKIGYTFPKIREEASQCGVFRPLQDLPFPHLEESGLRKQLEVERRPKGKDVGGIAIRHRDDITVGVVQPARVGARVAEKFEHIRPTAKKR